MNSFVLLSSAAFGLPVVQASAPETKSLSNGEGESTTRVKPTSLPLYPEAEKLEYTIQPPTKVETFVKDARTQAVKVKEEYQPALDRVSHVVNTGRAHTSEALFRLRDEDNLIGRVGLMTVGGLLGLIAARKGHLLKRITYFSTGLAATGSICYPKEAKVLAVDTGNLAAKNARIAYHFVVGTRPPIQNENGKAFDKMTNMVSDVWQWGFRLFEKKEPEVKVVEEPAPEKTILAETQELPPQNKEESSAALPNELSEPANPKEEAVPEDLQPAETEIKPVVPEETSDIPAQESQVREEAGSETDQTGETLKENEIAAVSYTDEQPVAVESSDISAQALAEVAVDISVQPAIDVIATEASADATGEAPSDSNSGSTAKAGLQLEGDLGQGNPEDKELYTTRE